MEFSQLTGEQVKAEFYGEHGLANRGELGDLVGEPFELQLRRRRPVNDQARISAGHGRLPRCYNHFAEFVLPDVQRCQRDNFALRKVWAGIEHRDDATAGELRQKPTPTEFFAFEFTVARAAQFFLLGFDATERVE